jgi:diguanylate cyclase (GGDEF)-like protein
MTEPAPPAAEHGLPSPSAAQPAPQAEAVFLSVHEIQHRLDRLERREWFLWWAVVVVMLLLTVAVVSLSFPELLRDANPFAQLHLSQSVRGLVGLVLIFNIYTIFQHFQIRKLRGKLAEQMAQIGELQMRAEEFYNLAVQDHLTGLYNRRYADERLAAEVRRCQRHGQSLTVMVIDIDNFKKINDQHGHAAGDKVLREFSTRLKRAVRSTDLAARTGGDEFMILLMECPPENASIFLNRIGVVDVDISGQPLRLGLSTGWAGFEKGDTVATLVERADKALYSNKRQAKKI